MHGFRSLGKSINCIRRIKLIFSVLCLAILVTPWVYAKGGPTFDMRVPLLEDYAFSGVVIPKGSVVDVRVHISYILLKHETPIPGDTVERDISSSSPVTHWSIEKISLPRPTEYFGISWLNIDGFKIGASAGFGGYIRVSGTMGKSATIGDIKFPAGSEMVIICDKPIADCKPNVMDISVSIALATNIGSLRLRPNTYVHTFNGISSARSPTITSVGGILYNGFIALYDDHKTLGGYLKTPQRIDGILCSDSYQDAQPQEVKLERQGGSSVATGDNSVFSYDEFGVSTGTPRRTGVRVGENKLVYFSAIAEDNQLSVLFYPSGKLLFCSLAHPFLFSGWPIHRWIALHENGKLKASFLAEDVTRDNTMLQKDSFVEFDAQGLLQKVNKP